MGEIKNGRQLDMDSADPAVRGCTRALCELGAIYIDALDGYLGLDYPRSSVSVDSNCYVHSYAGDYNPMHSHSNDSFIGLATGISPA